MKKVLFVLFAFSLVFAGCKKKGCMDSAALNYDPKAKQEDGSCEFPPPNVVITTTSASNISSTSAILGGNITSNGVSTVTQRGICYGRNPSPTAVVNITNNFTTDGTGTGSFISNVEQLTPGKTYYARAYAIHSADTTYGNEVSFNTTESFLLDKDFNDGSITSGGWTTQLVTGTLNWTVGEFGGQSYGNMSNYNGSTNEINESWLISPPINLYLTNYPLLSFNNAYSYTGNALEVLVSVDYSGNGDPNLATWTSITGEALWSSGFFEWVNSGPLSLISFQTADVYIAFKYTGSASDGSTWEVDDIKIEEL